MRNSFVLNHREGSFVSAVPPDVAEIDLNAIDVLAAIERFGYKFDDSTNPKRRALLVSPYEWSIRP
jgi:hypothetical protein